MKTPKNESILSGLLAKNPVWNEISGGDTADLANSIETGEWIGLMTGAEDNTDAGWDKYIADTFGPFADFVEGRYIKPDESEPDFRVAQIKFKPLFNRLSTNAKTGLLADLGDVLKDGYFVESKRKSEGRPKATDGRVHQFVFDFVITDNDTLSDVEDRIRNEIDLIDGIAKVSNGDSETSWPEAEYFGEALSPKLALRSKLTRVDNYLKGLYVFNSVIGRSAKDLHDKGFDLDMGLGDKGDCETEAKKALSDFDDYVEYNIVSEMENGKPYWYVDIKFKPEFWELGDSELGEVLTLLNGAIEEYA